MSSTTTAEIDLVAEDRSRRRGKFLAAVAFFAAFILGSIVIYRVLRILFAAAWLASHGGDIDWDVNLSNWRRSGGTSASFVSRVKRGLHVADADLLYLNELHRVQRLNLANCIDVTGAGLAPIAHLDDLMELDLARSPDFLELWTSSTNAKSSKLSDAALLHVKSLWRLTSLILSGNAITDAGLAQLSGLTNLEYLELDETLITDEGLQNLNGLNRLKTLSVINTKVTAEGAKALEAKIPGLVVTLKFDSTSP